MNSFTPRVNPQPQLNMESIAERYLNGSIPNLSDKELSDYKQLVAQQYLAMRIETGWGIQFVSYDPYMLNGKPSSKHMREEVLKTGWLEVYMGESHSDLLPGFLNLLGRAVHDYGHIITGGSFKFEGEVLACQPMLEACETRLQLELTFSEVVAQAATYWVTGSFVNCQKYIVGCWDEELALLGFHKENYL